MTTLVVVSLILLSFGGTLTVRRKLAERRRTGVAQLEAELAAVRAPFMLAALREVDELLPGTEKVAPREPDAAEVAWANANASAAALIHEAERQRQSLINLGAGQAQLNTAASGLQNATAMAAYYRGLCKGANHGQAIEYARQQVSDEALAVAQQRAAASRDDGWYRYIVSSYSPATQSFTLVPAYGSREVSRGWLEANRWRIGEALAELNAPEGR